MITEPPADSRSLKTVDLSCDLCIVGGGMAGVCCAITAARAGVKVVLIQDRPVLGGNASSEIRLWILGATVHSISHNRWAREGGVIDEVLVENTHRNPEGNPIIFDSIVLEMVDREPNLTVLLNTAAHEVTKVAGDVDRIASVTAFCAQNSTRYVVKAPLFCDASGDGVVGFLAGAAFRMGAESPEEFGEGFAPTGEFGYLLGHSIYFYTRDTGRPVSFTAPSFALTDVPGRIPRYKRFTAATQGCQLWWIEHGGRLDTVHETEAIKWELWRIVYGVWDYIKNSGEVDGAENLALDWVGMIPGKRESRRFEGDYMLRQQDVIERRMHDDDVAFGGWSIDLHPADGVYAQFEGSHHLHSKGVYPIPYRCLYSRNIANLFLSGRIISTSHVAFGSTRVMATCSHGAQAVARAARICLDDDVQPRDVLQADRMARLQRDLLRTGQHLIGRPLHDDEDLARLATITASSELMLDELRADAPPIAVDTMYKAQLLPMPAGAVPTITLLADVDEATTVQVELRTTSDARHHCADVTLHTKRIELAAGKRQAITIDSGATLKEPRHVFVCVAENPHVKLHTTTLELTGLMHVGANGTSNYTEVGGDVFEMFRPCGRRPDRRNLALRLDPPVAIYPPSHLTNGYQRPTNQTNAWCPALNDESPALTLKWDKPRQIGRIELAFDTDFDHAMETVLMGLTERDMPCCVRRYRITDSAGRVLHKCADNHQSRNTITLDKPIETETLVIDRLAAHGATSPPAIMEVRCYAE